MQAKEIKSGAIVNYNGAPCLIESVIVQSPTARGAATYYKYRGRNLITKQKVDITLRGGESLDEADFRKRPIKFMYADPTHVHLLDQENYEQYSLVKEDVAEESKYMTENLEGMHGPDLQRRVRRRAVARGRRAQGRAVRSGHQGRLGHRPHQARHAGDRPDRAGARVPLPGRDIKVDTRDGSYLSRA